MVQWMFTSGQKHLKAWLIAAILLALIGQVLTVQPAAAEEAKQEYTEAEINEMINNPLGELWLLFMQNDTTWYKGDALDFLGEDGKVFNTTTIQPVLPFQLTENWKYIFRPVITVNNWDVPSASAGTPTFYPGGELPFSVDWDRQWALGDTVLWNAFATNEMVAPPDIFGFGVTLMVPTATADWTADSDQRWTVPVGLGINTTTKIGPLPVKIGVEVYYYVEKPDNFGADMGLRFIFSPIIPKPGFSKIPIFN